MGAGQMLMVIQFEAKQMSMAELAPSQAPVVWWEVLIFSTDTNTHGQQHHRTSSNSSSSSEDDGEGGRGKEKIGITEKIKEKLTGQTMDQDQQASTTCTPAAGSGREGSYEGAAEGEQLEAGHENKKNDGHDQGQASWRRSPLN